MLKWLTLGALVVALDQIQIPVRVDVAKRQRNGAVRVGRDGAQRPENVADGHCGLGAGGPNVGSDPAGDGRAAWHLHRDRPGAHAGPRDPDRAHGLRERSHGPRRARHDRDGAPPHGRPPPRPLDRRTERNRLPRSTARLAGSVARSLRRRAARHRGGGAGAPGAARRARSGRRVPAARGGCSRMASTSASPSRTSPSPSTTAPAPWRDRSVRPASRRVAVPPSGCARRQRQAGARSTAPTRWPPAPRR